MRAGGHLLPVNAADAPRTLGADSRFHAKGFVAPVPVHVAACTTSEPTSGPEQNDSTLASVPFARWQSNAAKQKTGFNVSRNVDPLLVGVAARV